jgi:lipopolysaccharide/colanic/teichoic acid biosynthesis glycosyltransferase
MLSFFGLVFLSPLMGLIFLALSMQPGSPLFRQTRVGQSKQLFTLLKFRTMTPDTASMATHLVESSAVTPMGWVLRRTKLDELPQLWNVLKGEMSLVGPRPCLPNQDELIQERERLGVFQVRPGITGLAQIKGVDMSTPIQLAALDAEMVKSMSIKSYLWMILQTLIKSVR